MYTAGIEGNYLQILWQLMWLLGLKVCVVATWSVRLSSGTVLLSNPQTALFIKIQMKRHYIPLFPVKFLSLCALWWLSQH